MSIDNIPNCMKCPWYSRTLDWCNNPERDKCYHYVDFFDHKHGIK